MAYAAICILCSKPWLTIFEAKNARRVGYCIYPLLDGDVKHDLNCYARDFHINLLYFMMFLSVFLTRSAS